MGEVGGRDGTAPASAWSRLPVAGLAGLLLASGFAVLAISTLDFPRGSRTYPLAVLTAAALLFACVAVQNWRGDGSEAVDVPPPGWDGRTAGFLAVWVLYPVALMSIGFLTSTAVAISVSLALLRVRRPWRWVAGVLPVTLLVFALLQVVLNIALPQTPLDRLVADFLYGLRG